MGAKTTGPDLTTSDTVNAAHDEYWLRTLVEGVPQLIWRAAEPGLWSWCSGQWTTYTGQSEADSRGHGWLDVLHPDDRAGALQAWDDAVSASLLDVEYRIRRHDGRYRWFRTRAMPVRDGRGDIVEWLGTSTDIDELRRLEAQGKVLVAELQHRTRNLIAVVQAVAMQTADSSASLHEFTDRFDERLAALSRVQTLLSRSEHEPITIGKLVDLELAALGAGEGSGRIEIAGPDIAVRNSTAQTLALAVHELCTNALKHGALGDRDGLLSVDWRDEEVDAARFLILVWKETFASRPTGDERAGYGRVLIEEALPYELGAETSFTLTQTSLLCTIRIPLKHAQAGDLQ